MKDNVKKLYRSRDHSMIAGICGGLAEYFELDPTLVRLVFVVATLLGGPGLLAYIILLVLVPLEPVAGSITSAEAAPDELENP